MTAPYFSVERYLKQGLGRLAIQHRLHVCERSARAYIADLPAKRAEFDALLNDRNVPAKQAAAMWGCSRSHVENLRRKLAIPHKSRLSVDYTRIDALLDQYTTNAPIIEILCRESDTPRKKIKGRVEYRRHYRKITDEEEPREPFILPEKRQEMALAATRRRLGMDRQTFNRVWLPAHRWDENRGFVGVRG